MSAQASLLAWNKKAPTKKAMLRSLLSDGKWHGPRELNRVGHRFGAVIFRLHNDVNVGEGLARVHYQKRVDENDASLVYYRQTDKDACDICTKEARRKPSEVIAAQAKRIAELERENHSLKIRLEYAEGGRQ